MAPTFVESFSLRDVSLEGISSVDETYLVVASIAVVAVLLVIVSRIQSRRYSAKLPENVKPLDTLPGPTSWPIFGNIPDMLKDRPWKCFHSLGKQHGSIYRVKLWSKPLIVLNSAQNLKYVLSGNFKNFHKTKEAYDAFRPLLGWGLVTTEGDRWRKNRSIIMPSFHFDTLKTLMSVYQDAAKRLLGDLEKMKEGQYLMCDEAFRRLTLEVIGEAAIGMMPGPENPLERIFFSVCTELNLRFWYPFRKYLPTPTNFRHHAQLRELNNMIREAIKERRSENYVHTGPRDMLELLLAARDKDTNAGLSDSEVLDEMKTMLLAGHETTSMWLTWTFHLLSQHGEVAAKVQAEIDEVLGDKDVPEYEDLAALKYTTAVLKEVMRVVPPVPVLSRECVEDDIVDGYHIPKGTELIIDIWSRHYDPQHWETPEKFNPDHFFDEAQVRARHQYAYLPFSQGPRVCIGQNFAMLETKVAVATLLKKYDFVSAPGHEVRTSKFDIPICPVNGVKVLVQPRNKNKNL